MSLDDKMSGQRIHHKSSPSSVKQGPMRATIPMSSLFRQQTTNLRKSKSNSPTSSPTNAWKVRLSPDHSSGQRSPGSTCYKANSKTLSGGCSGTSSSSVIRRTASLDTIYLKGQWPRDCSYMYTNYLQVDKATQTDDWMNDSRKPHRYIETCGGNGSDEKLKMIRHRLQRNTQQVVCGRERSSLQVGALPGDHTVTLPSTSSQTTNTSSTMLSPTKASPVNIPMKPIARPPMRSSIEGLNQEIERLVLKATGTPGALFTDRCDDDKFQQITPEGHRAPLADLLRSTRSVNTQTPAASDLTGSCHSSGQSSRESNSPPYLPGLIDEPRTSSEQGESQGSSPDQETGKLGTSPHINRFLAREPPDGCEKVNLKFGEESARRPVIDLCPLKPCVAFQLKPSLGSAFYPLQQPPSPTGSSDDVSTPLPLVPPADRP